MIALQEEYNFCRLSIDNLGNLISLYKACFNYKIRFEYLLEKYNTHAFGASFVGFIAFSKTSNLPAAYYGVFPIRCKARDKVILAAQSGDTMTHPQHQGKGLFTTLAQLTYDLARQQGISFVFGFPNRNSYPGFIKKLYWSHYADINNYSIKTGSIPFDKIAKKFPFFSQIYASFVVRRLARFITGELLPNSLESLDPKVGFVIHDLDFYQYKRYHRIYRIKVNKVLCVIKIDGRMWIGDIDSCSEVEFFAVINTLRKLATKLGCSSIQFSVFNDSSIDRRLNSRYKISSKNPIGCIELKKGVFPERFAYQALDFDTF